jgi:hypothetical protein
MRRRLGYAEEQERAMNLTARTVLLAALLISASAYGADELGRLFFTPEQRAQLEYDRPQGVRPGDSRRAITVDGIVQRHGGKRTIWINGVPQDAGASDESSPESVPVAIPGQSQPARTKVGEKVLINPVTEPGQ